MKLNVKWLSGAAHAVHTTGKTPDEIEETALELYLNREGANFLFIECWRILSKCPKWNEDFARLAQGPGNSETKEGEVADPNEEKRPPGNKASKNELFPKKKLRAGSNAQRLLF